MNKNQSGQSVIELILASAIFVIFASGSVMAVIQGYNSNRLSLELTVANQFASEGIEAVRSIKNQSYANLTSVNSSSRAVVRNVSNVWAFGADNSSDSFDSGKYTRTVKVESVNRDGSGNIVSSGGTLDPDTRKITSTVSWNFNSARPESVTLTTYLSDWRKPIPLKGGVLVYGDGGTTQDAMKYRLLDGLTGLWGPVQNFPDFDTTASNKALRAVRVYSSSTRNEKFALTRHFNGTQQYIFAHIFNGTTWTSVQLSSWTAATFTDVRNFDGAYLVNGNFVAVFSDNTTTPKYRVWNGAAWSGQQSLVNLANNNSGIPLYIAAKSRPNTNEIMVSVFDQASDTNTQYFDGANWTLHSRHAANASGQVQLVDFSWNISDPTKGALLYTSTNNDRNTKVRIFTANGSGSGAWSNTSQSSNQGVIGALGLATSPSIAEFLSCNKNSNNDIYCFKATTNGVWSTPANNIVSLNTDSGIQRSYDLSFEGSSGTNALVIYSDNTSTPKMRTYNGGSSPAFSSESNFTQALSGTLKTVKLKTAQFSDDIMVLLGDANNRLYTVVWDGNANYTSPSGKAFSTHGTNGSSTSDFWYDFAWDGY
jgi:hypothetical protein